MSKKSNSNIKKKVLKIAIPLAIIIIAAIVFVVVFAFSNKDDKKTENPNLAIYLQESQLKCSYLDKINPIVLGNDYPYKKINTGLVNYGKYYDTASFVGNGVPFLDSNTIVYPLSKENSEDDTKYQSLNLNDGSTSSYYYEKTTNDEKFYSPDGKYYYIIDTYSTDTGVLTACKSKNAKTVFTIDNVSGILGIKQETGEIYYSRETGTEKLELYKTIKGEETRIDYGITSLFEFYPTGEAYYCKGDDLYYCNGDNSKKIAQVGDYYFKSRSFASDTATAAIANGKSLNVIVKDTVKIINCVTDPHDIVCSEDGSTVFYLDNVHEAGFYVGKVDYNKTNPMNVGDLHKITIDGSQISEPELYDTEVSKETVKIENDGAVRYYKNYMLLFGIVNLNYPTSLDIGDFYVNKKLIGEKVNFVEYVSQNEIYYISEVDNLKNVDNLVVKNDNDIDNSINSFYPTLIEIESPKNFTSGVLKKYDGTHSITMADNVHEYYVKDNGQVLMLMNCDEDTYRGELYLYNENGDIFIDYDVTDIVRFG